MKYGLVIASTENLGDDIQSLAAMQFLPRVDILLNRENLNKIKLKEPVKAIMNGWFMHKPENWPPSPTIKPLFISFHITPNARSKMLSSQGAKYLKMYEPIGARDLYTLNILKEKGIKSYFSGCLTLTFDYRYGDSRVPERDRVLLIDVDKEAMEALISNQSYKRVKSEIISHQLFNPTINLLQYFTPSIVKALLKKTNTVKILENFFLDIDLLRGRLIQEKRLKRAMKVIWTISSAKLVITSRLHAALPAIGLGVPVLFIHRNISDPRFTGLLDFLNYYSLPEFKRKIKEIDLENPPENPNQGRLKKLKDNLIRTVKEFTKN